MKKVRKINLSLNKKVVANLELDKIVGGVKKKTLTCKGQCPPLDKK